MKICQVKQENCINKYDSTEGYKTTCENKECLGNYKLKFYIK